MAMTLHVANIYLNDFRIQQHVELLSFAFIIRTLQDAIRLLAILHIEFANKIEAENILLKRNAQVSGGPRTDWCSSASTKCELRLQWPQPSHKVRRFIINICGLFREK